MYKIHGDSSCLQGFLQYLPNENSVLSKWYVDLNISHVKLLFCSEQMSLCDLFVLKEELIKVRHLLETVMLLAVRDFHAALLQAVGSNMNVYYGDVEHLGGSDSMQ